MLFSFLGFICTGLLDLVTWPLSAISLLSPSLSYLSSSGGGGGGASSGGAPGGGGGGGSDSPGGSGGGSSSVPIINKNLVLRL